LGKTEKYKRFGCGGDRSDRAFARLFGLKRTSNRKGKSNDKGEMRGFFAALRMTSGFGVRVSKREQAEAKAAAMATAKASCSGRNDDFVVGLERTGNCKSKNKCGDSSLRSE